MTTLTASHLTQSVAAAPRGFVSALAWIAGIGSIFGAATRVARAVESRREPADADLKILGIPGPLPRQW